jgi:hypothetical protein
VSASGVVVPLTIDPVTAIDRATVLPLDIAMTPATDPTFADAAIRAKTVCAGTEPAVSGVRLRAALQELPSAEICTPVGAAKAMLSCRLLPLTVKV